MKFSFFYFSAEEGTGKAQKYRLLIEGAKFADAHGFVAVWTPERHFHPFGALYPNPSVTTAALAMITQKVQLRAGSLVLPLHHPVRVAEEWAVADNLSNGRVAISLASGWNAHDFVLQPANYEDRQKAMYEGLATLRKLWAGETIRTPGVAGAEVELRIYPRPVQRDLPIWVTSAGNPETWVKAGEVGANVLTHLVRQSLPDIEKKIRLYREARARHGHDPGQVSLMIHTFVGEDVEAVRQTVRAPFMAYLKTSADIFGGAGAGRKQLVDRTPEELERALAKAFDMYFESSVLMGTPESCQPMVERLRAIGIDELACLLDFGVDDDAVLGSLPFLDRLRAASQR
jgi:natural product biosynthesis luciferase-like monooxygenase protein